MFIADSVTIEKTLAATVDEIHAHSDDGHENFVRGSRPYNSAKYLESSKPSFKPR